MSPEEFDACFDRFTTSVIRVETLQRYTVAEEAERVSAFLRGEPRPERSVRTSPWLGRIATTTAVGKSWQRVHVVQHPLSDYLRYQLVGYVESQACGEQIRLATHTTDLADAVAVGDFWLFDARTNNPYVVDMHYVGEGRWLGAALVTEPDQVRIRRVAADLIWSAGSPLNQFLAALPRLERARSA
jgi:hypothetical protein